MAGAFVAAIHTRCLLYGYGYGYGLVAVVVDHPSASLHFSSSDSTSQPIPCARLQNLVHCSRISTVALVLSYLESRLGFFLPSIVCLTSKAITVPHVFGYTLTAPISIVF